MQQRILDELGIDVMGELGTLFSLPTSGETFLADEASGISPLLVQFVDESTLPSITSWAWDFDHDGVVDSDEQNPQFTYDEPGTYSVKLVVNNDTESSSFLRMNYIRVISLPYKIFLPLLTRSGNSTAVIPDLGK